MPFFDSIKKQELLYSGILRPNCLITRFPILFLDGAKSLFFSKNLWSGIPSFTAEHGYEVFRLRTPDLKLRKCQKYFINQLQELNIAAHIISISNLDEFFELECLLKEQNLCHSWTQVTVNPRSRIRNNNFNYNLWLDHLISLAEIDHSLKNSICHLQKMKFIPY